MIRRPMCFRAFSRGCGMSEQMQQLPPADWKPSTIGQVSECVLGGTPSTEVPRFWGGDIPWMASGDVHLRRIHEVPGRITALGLRSSNATLTSPPAVAVGLAGQGKTRGTVALTLCTLSTNQSIALLQANGRDLRTDYLFHNLDRRYEELRARSSGGGRGGLSKAILEAVPIDLPPLIDQQKISEILDTLDEAIHQTGAIVEKLNLVRDGLLHDLLTRGIDAHGELRQALPASILLQPLSALAYINPKTAISLPTGAELSFVPMGATSESGEIVGAEPRKWGSAGSGMTFFQDDDVLVAKITPCFENGKGGLARDLKNGFGFGSTEFHVLRSKPGNHPSFIHYWTTSPSFRSQGESYMTGTAGQRRVTAEFFDKFLVPAFRLEEQTLIAKILDAQTSRINVEVAQLRKLRAQKSGLMDDLLAGRVRVTPLLAQ